MVDNKFLSYPNSLKHTNKMHDKNQKINKSLFKAIFWSGGWLWVKKIIFFCCFFFCRLFWVFSFCFLWETYSKQYHKKFRNLESTNLSVHIFARRNFAQIREIFEGAFLLEIKSSWNLYPNAIQTRNNTYKLKTAIILTKNQKLRIQRGMVSPVIQKKIFRKSFNKNYKVT